MTEKNGNKVEKADVGIGPSLQGAGITASSGSTEDLSEYTDADESISAPTECLAEFLSAVMLKDYPTALKYCKIILQYEPNNITAKEFYPLIITKLNKLNMQDNSDSSECDDNYNVPDAENENDSGNTSEDSSDSDHSDSSESEKGSGDILGGSHSAHSESYGTTHSCSSLEDEEAELLMKTTQKCLDLGNGNHSGISESFPGTSDSESPTEPLTQQAVSMLRSKALGKVCNGYQK